MLSSINHAHALFWCVNSFIALYVAFKFFLLFHTYGKIFLETELEALNDNEIYLKSDRGTQLILWP